VSDADGLFFCAFSNLYDALVMAWDRIVANEPIFAVHRISSEPIILAAHLRRYDRHPSVLGRSDMSQLAVGRETGAWIAPNYNPRLSDKILIAFQDACENDELEVAAQLLRVLDIMVARQTIYPARARALAEIAAVAGCELGRDAQPARRRIAPLTTAKSRVERGHAARPHLHSRGLIVDMGPRPANARFFACTGPPLAFSCA
jgi:hypothetical protein